MTTPLLAAGDIELLIKVGVFLFFIVGAIIKKFASLMQNPPRGPQGQPGGGLTLQLDELLRKARELQQQESQERAAATRPPKNKPPRPPKPKNLPKRAPLTKKTQPQAAPTESVAEHVAKRLSNESVFAQRADALVDDIKQADQERELHRQQMFVHQVGNLADSSATAAMGNGPSAPLPPPPLGAAASAAPSTGVTTPLVALLNSPEGRRQALALQLILDRPVDQWE